MPTAIENVEFENAKIIYANFRGEERRNQKGKIVNQEGKRNFCVLIQDNDMAQRMSEDGWNVKIHQPYEEGDEPFYYLPVEVGNNFNRNPVYMLTKKNKTQLNEDTISSLDGSDISYVDLLVRPFQWEVNGDTGIKAYVKEMYVTINESAFADKYAQYPENDDF